MKETAKDYIEAYVAKYLTEFVPSLEKEYQAGGEEEEEEFHLAIKDVEKHESKEWKVFNHNFPLDYLNFMQNFGSVSINDGDSSWTKIYSPTEVTDYTKELAKYVGNKIGKVETINCVAFASVDPYQQDHFIYVFQGGEEYIAKWCHDEPSKLTPCANNFDEWMKDKVQEVEVDLMANM